MQDSAVSIDVAVRVDRWYTTEMCIENFRPIGEEILADEIDEALHGFSLIDRVRHHAFHASAQPDGRIGFFGWNTVGRIGEFLSKDNIVRFDFLAKPNKAGRVLRDGQHLRPGLLRWGGGVDSNHFASATILGESHQHPRVRRTGHCAHDDIVKLEPELSLLLASLFGEADIAETTIFVHRSPGGNSIRLPAFRLYVFYRPLPALADADIETFVDEFDFPSQDSAHQDIPNPVVDRILEWNPAFLNETAFHAEFCSDSRDLARVV